MHNKSISLYDHVVEITHDYLGPAADRFIDRQIRNHLRKNPEHLVKKDLIELISWIKVAMAMLTDDDKLVSEYVSHLDQLTRDRIR